MLCELCATVLIDVRFIFRILMIDHKTIAVLSFHTLRSTFLSLVLSVFLFFCLFFSEFMNCFQIYGIKIQKGRVKERTIEKDAMTYILLINLTHFFTVCT